MSDSGWKARRVDVIDPRRQECGSGEASRGYSAPKWQITALENACGNDKLATVHAFAVQDGDAVLTSRILGHHTPQKLGMLPTHLANVGKAVYIRQVQFA